MSGILASTFFPATAWIPTYLSTLVGWFDASDSSTITNSGGKASQWNDKSANANNLTPNSTDKPTITSAGINGLNTLTFASLTGMQALAASGLPSTTTGIGFGGVFLPTNLSSKVAVSLGNHTATTNEAMLFFFATTLATLRTANQAGSTSTVGNTDTTNAHLYSGTVTTALRDVYKDGTQGTSQSTAEASKTSVDLALGFQLASTNYLLGQIAEVVLFSGSSSTDRQQVEGYLAWKWGLQGNLPGGHPYKNAPP